MQRFTRRLRLTYIRKKDYLRETLVLLLFKAEVEVGEVVEEVEVKEEEEEEVAEWVSNASANASNSPRYP